MNPPDAALWVGYRTEWTGNPPQAVGHPRVARTGLSSLLRTASTNGGPSDFTDMTKRVLMFTLL
jgi:hypothetical protein